MQGDLEEPVGIICRCGKRVTKENSREKDKGEGDEMEKDIKGLKRSFWMAVVIIAVLLVLITGATFAWFNMNGLTSTNVTPIGGTVSEGESVLLISNSAGGNFDKTCELVLSGNPDVLKPVSTDNLDQFYMATVQDKEGMAVLYKTVGDDRDSLMLHGTVYLQCRNAACSVYFNRDELELGVDSQALASMRLGMKMTTRSGTVTYIFRLDALGATGREDSRLTVPQAGTVVSSISGDGRASYVADPSVNISDYMATKAGGAETYAPAASKLADLDKDEVATVEYWLYLEGCDEQCINAVQNRNAGIRLAFAGVDRVQ